MNLQIANIEYYLPQKLITNNELQQIHLNWDMSKLAEKTGVFNRYIVEHNETAFDLACKAVDKLIQGDRVLTDSLNGILFCTQSPDYIMPSNAFLIHKYLNLKQSVFAFDYNLACSGFIYGIAIAKGFIAAKLANNILLINADTYSKYIHPKDRSATILFGDGASACLLSGIESEGIIDIILASSGKDFESFYIPSGGCRIPKSYETSIEKIDESGNIRTDENIHMNGFGVWKFISTNVPKQIFEILNRNNYSLNDIDLYIFHQASKLTIDSLVKALKINPNKVFSNIANVGNLVSASIPVAIKDAEKAGKLNRGDLILLSGFGVGLSWGTVIMKY
ncbi:MAG: ketoacyl-ACP synthase III [Bacteroidetes bacterium]|nr:ketoacyl-ACP synthase III [Bacteroidota bacterium]